MLEHLEAYCTVNEIEDNEALITAGQSVIDMDDKEIVSLARKGTILVLFRKFIDGQLTLEQFINNGEELNDDLEVTHHASVMYDQPYRREAPRYMLKRLELDDMLWANTLFVLEKQVWDEYAHQQQLIGALEERSSRLVVV